MPTPKIFISYRRDDSAGHAGRLCDRFEAVFGPEAVFRDAEDIAAGDDFVDTLHAQVDQCELLLALIGPRWLTATDAEGRRRLDQDRDWVRREIARGLDRQIRVIPVLLQGAKLPRATELPDELRALPRRQAAEVRDAHFDRDVDHLLTLVAPGHGRLRRYRFAIAALLIVTLGISGYALHSQRERQRLEQKTMAEQAASERTPEAAVEWLTTHGYSYGALGFIDAIHAGDRVAVRYYLQAGMDADERHPERNPPLIEAAIKGKAEIVRLLLDHGANPEDALGTSIGHGHAEVTELLLSRAPAAAELQKALGIAAQVGDLKLMERLVSMGATVDALAGDALLSATSNGQVTALRWLLERKANPALATREGDWTPLHVAAAYSTGTDAHSISDAMVEQLLAAGLSADAYSESLTRLFPTPLLLAINSNNTGSALRLIAAGAKPETPASQRKGQTALHLAAEKNQVDVLIALLDHGAPIDARDQAGRTALMAAAGAGSTETLSVLIARKPDLEARDGADLNALMHAVRAPSLGTTDALLKANMQVDAQTRDGNTALLLLAARRPYQGDGPTAREAAQIAQRLIEAGASRTTRNARGETALAIAQRQQSELLVRALETP